MQGGERLPSTLDLAAIGNYLCLMIDVVSDDRNWPNRAHSADCDDRASSCLEGLSDAYVVPV